MSDVVSVELLLDRASEEAVRADWDRLAAAGFSSMGAYRSASNRPHLTLLVRSSLPQISFARAAALLPIAVRLEDPIVFPHGDRGVLVRPVALTDGLVGLHRVVHECAPGGEDAPHMRPGEWTPHVTLARRLRLDSLDEALAVLGAPIVGTGAALRRWDAAEKRVTPLV